jgi:ribonuclease Y
MNGYAIGLALIGFVVGFGLAFWFKMMVDRQKADAARTEADLIVQESKAKADALIKEASLEAKDRLLKMKSEFDNETKETRAELKKQEKRLFQKEENIDKKIELFEQKEKEIGQLEKDLERRSEELAGKETEYHSLISHQREQLERLSALTAEQAKELLLRAMENEARYEGAKIIKRIENEAKEEADKKAKKILATAIQRYAADYVAERTVTVVQLPSDEMKGRIIGREGRNLSLIHI